MKVIILCGGKGGRMLPLTKELPKPLVPLNGQPTIQHIIDLYDKKGLKEFVLCIGYMGDAIKDYFKDKKYNIIFSDSGEEASMLKRIMDAKQYMNQRAIISYADTITNIDVKNLVKFHETKKALVTILVTKIKNPFGLVKFDEDNKCTSFDEKPTFHYYIGHIVMEKEALNAVSKEMLEMKDGEGLVTFFKDLAGKGLLYVYEHDGVQITFNTLTERDKAEKELIEFYTYREEQ